MIFKQYSFWGIELYPTEVVFYMKTLDRSVKTDPEEAYDIEEAVVEDLRNPSAPDRALAKSTFSSL